MRILYGSSPYWKDVTILARQHYTKYGKLVIPSDDYQRALVFGDVVPYVQKEVRIVTASDSKTYTGEIILAEPLLTIAEQRAYFWSYIGSKISEPVAKLAHIHSQVSLLVGSMAEEYPEQLLAVRYVDKDATVLELGGNVGRNSCTIASLLRDDRKLVSVESFAATANILCQNRDHNEFHFSVEAAALSRVPLAQSGWITIPYQGVVPDGYTPVNTISFDDLEAKYHLTFDTIVADCEGALGQILRDDPMILRNIKTFIVENDYQVQGDKEYVDTLLAENGLKLVYSEAGGWGHYSGQFYQVFQR